ncbi:MAG: DUF4198 domain-containing protein [Planctomycetes bacterium]|nr:DUF4198 domain-containing protein [Planctomycetota bacterium]
MRLFTFATLASLLVAATSFAHYNMLFPDKPWATKGEKVTFTYQYGHPYEHELSDAPMPSLVRVVNPRGETLAIDVDKNLKAIKKDGADGKKVTAWQFTFTPEQRGDFTVFLKTPRIKHEKGPEVVDVVRVVLHVQTQNGWDQAKLPFLLEPDIVPQTRPYGLLAGMVFKGQVVRHANVDDFKYVSGLPVEIEKYNEKPPKKLPPDELITFKTKTDRHGYFVTTLPEPGWWGMTAIKRGAENHIERATLWVHVNEKK